MLRTTLRCPRRPPWGSSGRQANPCPGHVALRKADGQLRLAPRSQAELQRRATLCVDSPCTLTSIPEEGNNPWMATACKTSPRPRRGMSRVPNPASRPYLLTSSATSTNIWSSSIFIPSNCIPDENVEGEQLDGSAYLSAGCLRRWRRSVLLVTIHRSHLSSPSTELSGEALT